MNCKVCGAPSAINNGDGEFYCEKCMKKRRIKNPKTYHGSLKKYM